MFGTAEEPESVKEATPALSDRTPPAFEFALRAEADPFVPSFPSLTTMEEVHETPFKVDECAECEVEEGEERGSSES